MQPTNAGQKIKEHLDSSHHPGHHHANGVQYHTLTMPAHDRDRNRIYEPLPSTLHGSSTPLIVARVPFSSTPIALQANHPNLQSLPPSLILPSHHVPDALRQHIGNEASQVQVMSTPSRHAFGQLAQPISETTGNTMHGGPQQTQIPTPAPAPVPVTIPPSGFALGGSVAPRPRKTVMPIPPLYDDTPPIIPPPMQGVFANSGYPNTLAPPAIELGQGTHASHAVHTGFPAIQPTHPHPMQPGYPLMSGTTNHTDPRQLGMPYHESIYPPTTPSHTPSYHAPAAHGQLVPVAGVAQQQQQQQQRPIPKRPVKQKTVPPRRLPNPSGARSRSAVENIDHQMYIYPPIQPPSPTSLPNSRGKNVSINEQPTQVMVIPHMDDDDHHDVSEMGEMHRSETSQRTTTLSAVGTDHVQQTAIPPASIISTSDSVSATQHQEQGTHPRLQSQSVESSQPHHDSAQTMTTSVTDHQYDPSHTHNPLLPIYNDISSIIAMITQPECPRLHWFAVLAYITCHHAKKDKRVHDIHVALAHCLPNIPLISHPTPPKLKQSYHIYESVVKVIQENQMLVSRHHSGGDDSDGNDISIMTRILTIDNIKALLTRYTLPFTPIQSIVSRLSPCFSKLPLDPRLFFPTSYYDPQEPDQGKQQQAGQATFSLPPITCSNISLLSHLYGVTHGKLPLCILLFSSHEFINLGSDKNDPILKAWPRLSHTWKAFSPLAASQLGLRTPYDIATYKPFRLAGAIYHYALVEVYLLRCLYTLYLDDQEKPSPQQQHSAQHTALADYWKTIHGERHQSMLLYSSLGIGEYLEYQEKNKANSNSNPQMSSGLSSSSSSGAAHGVTGIRGSSHPALPVSPYSQWIDSISPSYHPSVQLFTQFSLQHYNIDIYPGLLALSAEELVSSIVHSPFALYQLHESSIRVELDPHFQCYPFNALLRQSAEVFLNVRGHDIRLFESGYCLQLYEYALFPIYIVCLRLLALWRLNHGGFISITPQMQHVPIDLSSSSLQSQLPDSISSHSQSLYAPATPTATTTHTTMDVSTPLTDAATIYASSMHSNGNCIHRGIYLLPLSTQSIRTTLTNVEQRTQQEGSQNDNNNYNHSNENETRAPSSTISTILEHYQKSGVNIANIYSIPFILQWKRWFMTRFKTYITDTDWTPVSSLGSGRLPGGAVTQLPSPPALPLDEVIDSQPISLVESAVITGPPGLPIVDQSQQPSPSPSQLQQEENSSLDSSRHSSRNTTVVQNDRETQDGNGCVYHHQLSTDPISSEIPAHHIQTFQNTSHTRKKMLVKTKPSRRTRRDTRTAAEDGFIPMTSSVGFVGDHPLHHQPHQQQPPPRSRRTAMATYTQPSRQLMRNMATVDIQLNIVESPTTHKQYHGRVLGVFENGRHMVCGPMNLGCNHPKNVEFITSYSSFLTGIYDQSMFGVALHHAPLRSLMCCTSSPPLTTLPGGSNGEATHESGGESNTPNTQIATHLRSSMGPDSDVVDGDGQRTPSRCVFQPEYIKAYHEVMQHAQDAPQHAR